MLEDILNKPLTLSQVIELNPIALAFIGDGVHTLYVRDRIIKSNNLLVNNYHRLASNECRAVSQAENLDKILPILNDDELNIVKRARNAKLHHTAKNSDEKEYRKATSFEALIGYLYLLGKYDRLKEILDTCIDE